MKRRELIKGIGLVAGALSISGSAMAAEPVAGPKKKRILRIAHLTDIHMRPELNAPDRFRQCMKEIKKHKIDFFLNGGDTIFAADYGTSPGAGLHSKEYNAYKSMTYGCFFCSHSNLHTRFLPVVLK